MFFEIQPYWQHGILNVAVIEWETADTATPTATAGTCVVHRCRVGGEEHVSRIGLVEHSVLSR